MNKKRLFIFILLSVFVLGCKSQKALIASSKRKLGSKKELSLEKVVKRYTSNKIKYKTFSSKTNMNYDFGMISASNTFTLRMKRDSIIWMSASFGIVKVKITPSRVSFYNKLSKTYSDMTYDEITSWIGTEIDFNFIQNILVGNIAIEIKNREILSFHREDNSYRLRIKGNEDFYGNIFINMETFRLQSQGYIKENKKEGLAMVYTYDSIKKLPYPYKVDMNIITRDKKFSIDFQYHNVEINHPMRFPYKVPSGYKKIYLK